MATKYQITRKEYENYQEQLARINHEIDENTKALKEAREQGDLSENADYSAAKEKQGNLAAEKSRVEEIIKNSEIVDVDTSDAVGIGKYVTISYKGPKGVVEEKFLISASIASDILINKLSTDSPIGKALVGHKKGDTVHVQTPVGMLAVTIVDVTVENK